MANKRRKEGEPLRLVLEDDRGLRSEMVVYECGAWHVATRSASAGGREDSQRAALARAYRVLSALCRDE